MNHYTTDLNSLATTKIFPALGRASLRANVGRSFRWWSVLRGAKVDGVEWFTFDEVRNLFATHGWSRKQAYDCLDAAISGSPFFSVGNDGRLWLKSLENACMTLETVPGRPVEIPASSLRKQNTFQAEIYASMFDGEVKVSRAWLQSEYNLSKNTQRTYERNVGVKVAPTFVYLDVEAVDDRFKALSLPDGIWAWTDEQNHRIIWQSKNVYKFTASIARRGMERKVTRTVRSGLNMGEVERRRPFLVDDVLQDAKRWRGVPGGYAVKTTEQWDVYHGDGRVSVGSLYKLMSSGNVH